MPDGRVLLDLIRKRADQRILFSQHAVAQMSRPERMITPIEIRKVISTGEIIEDYPGHRRGPCCLVYARVSRGRNLHVVVTTEKIPPRVITVYEPKPPYWVTPRQRRRAR